jgi:hypothetical protein
MFRNGENSIHSMQWDILDTPPAKSWINMLEYSLENPKENPLSVTDAVFCKSKEEARDCWNQLRTQLDKLNHRYTKIPFAGLSKKNCVVLLKELQDSITMGSTKSIDRAYEFNDMISKLKKLLFYFDRYVDPSLDGDNEGSTFGYIGYSPDPQFGIEFKESWIEYLTFDIEPGTLYAELYYPNAPWTEILQLGDIKNAYAKIKHKEFGAPNYMSSAFYIPMHPDIAAIETDLIEYFYKHLDAIKHCDPTFDPMRALQVSGKLPIARLRNQLTENDYLELTPIHSMFKLELYDTY